MGWIKKGPQLDHNCCILNNQKMLILIETILRRLVEYENYVTPIFTISAPNFLQIHLFHLARTQGYFFDSKSQTVACFASEKLNSRQRINFDFDWFRFLPLTQSVWNLNLVCR